MREPLPADDLDVLSEGVAEGQQSTGAAPVALPGLGYGQPLPADLLERAEAHYGTDLSGVRVHTGSAAAAQARQRAAEAFTFGQNVVFGEGRYAPWSPLGSRLLGHELAHTIQQRGRTPTLQAAPIPAGDKHGDATVYLWQELGQLGIDLSGQPWVQVRWDPAITAGNFTYTISRGDNPRHYSIHVKTTFPIRVTINRQAEQLYQAPLLGETVFAHRYEANGNTVTVNEHVEAEFTFHFGEVFEDAEVYPGNQPPVRTLEIERGLEIPLGPGLPQEKKPEQITHFYWQFDTTEQLEGFAAVWANHFWIEEAFADQRPTAVALDEDAMQTFARAYRDGVGFEPTRIFIDGKPQDPERMYEMFYSSIYSAQDGAIGDHDECLIYSHGKKSYGRVTLNHHEAQSYWWYLDIVGSDKVQPVDGYPFVELRVRGASGELHSVDMDYVHAREDLAALAERRRKEEAGRDLLDSAWALIDGPPSWDEILEGDYNASRYLQIAVDRDESAIPQGLRNLLDDTPGLADAVGDRILSHVEREARSFARYAIDAAMQGLKRYSTEEGARQLILLLPGMTANERRDSLAYVGLQPLQQTIYAAVLSDPALAVRVWMGEDLYGIDAGHIASAAKSRITELKTFGDAVFYGQVEPLHMEGDFGVEIRRKVYKSMGFNLDPNDYPHSGSSLVRKVQGRRLGSSSVFGTEAAYLYADAAARRASDERLKKYLIIAAVVVATVALVLVANAAGAALAGLLFEAGTAGFIITEVVVSATIVTALGPATHTFVGSMGSATAEDYSAAYDNLGTQFVVNLATFGFFKGLGMATRSIAIAGAGGEEAFMASRGWRAAEAGLRVGTSGAAFFGIGVLSSLIQKGEVPQGEAMNELVFETALSLVLLEVGAFMTRGTMVRIGKWSRAKRLGELAPRMDALQLKAIALNREVAEFAVRPHGAKDRGMEILGSQKQLLAEYTALVKDMQKSFRTRTTGERYAKQLDPVLEQLQTQLNGLKAVEFFANAEIRVAGTSKEAGEFYYKRGTEAQIREFYGKQGMKVTDTGNGVLEVRIGGAEGRTMTFRPSAKLDPTLQPGGGRKADVLEAWRRSLAARNLEVLQKAHDQAISNTELNKIAKSDPYTMSETQLKTHERLLKRADAKLDKAIAKYGPPDLTVERAGREPRAWQDHLVSVRDHVKAQAKLLGLEANPAIEMVSRLRTGGKRDLKVDTLQRHADLIKQGQDVVERARTTRDSSQTTRLQLQPQPTVPELRARLKARQTELKRRAKVYGSSSTDYIKKALKGLGSSSKLDTLRAAEQRLEAAEARLDKRALAELEGGVALHGQAAVDAARTGSLAEMSDIQVGDAMRGIRGATEKLTPQALKGALYASMAPPEGSTVKSAIPLEKAVRYARSPEELTFALESFAAIREAGIEGGYQVLRDATASPSKWQGSVWQMEAARLIIGLENIARFEFPLRAGTKGREVDIVLKDGTKVEMKDWSDWKGLRGKLDDQFKVDLESETRGGTDASGIRKIRWMFRFPPPADLATIRARMKGNLETFIKEKLDAGSINADQAQALRDAFGDHLGIVEAPKIDRTKVHKPVPVPQPPMPVPVTPGMDDEQ